MNKDIEEVIIPLSNPVIKQLSEDLAEYYAVTPKEALYRLEHGCPSKGIEL